MSEAAEQIPMLLVMPQAVLSHTRDHKEISAAEFAAEWRSLLHELMRCKLKEPVLLEVGTHRRRFKSVAEVAHKMAQMGAVEVMEGLEWVAHLTKMSVEQMHAFHAEWRRPEYSTGAAQEGAQQLGMIAEKRAAAFGNAASRMEL